MARQPSARGDAPEEANPADTLTSDFQPLEFSEAQFLLLSHPVFGILLWESELTNTRVTRDSPIYWTRYF